jgi:cyclic pyranopterin phosphate synthase
MSEFTHFGADGGGRMVDVGGKPVTERMAKASATVIMQPETLQTILESRAEKGDVLAVARLAGIMAAKRTGDLIPLCHPLGIDAIELTFETKEKDRIVIGAEVKVQAKTGVEMEALVAASTAALTVYDMCKAIDRGMVITNVQLEEKSGGRSGPYTRA